MRLQRLVIGGFRNLAPADLDTDARFVVFSGQNAQGKTNALEAVWLLATLKPLRGHRTRNLIGWDAAESHVSGWVNSQIGVRQHRVELTEQGRSVSLDGKKTQDLADYFSGIRAIAFQPGDGEILAGEPANRRAWLDRAAFTAHPAHLELVRTYKRTLEQKSAVLKSPRPESALLDVLDTQLASLGARLAERREALVEDLLPHVRQVHTSIVGVEQEVRLRYRTCAPGETLQQRQAALQEHLAGVRSRELQRRRTQGGPHTDDLDVQLDGKPIRTFGSRGQVRSLVLALKLAEMHAARQRGDVPMFLLDDVSSELDKGRTRRLVESLTELGAQVFATTTDPGHMDSLPTDETRHVQVRDGQLVTEA